MTSKPLALDLCCGKGGWTIGLQKAGWDVWGFDVEAWPGYPGHQVTGDVRKVHVRHDSSGRWYLSIEPSTDTESWLDWPLPAKPLLVCASPPCQQFSYRSFPFKRCRELAANVPPDKSIWEACVRIADECEAPLILENVRGAEKYMGRAKRYYGSFYLWGDVPAILPVGRPRKGFGRVKEMNNPSDPYGGFGGSTVGAKKMNRFAPGKDAGKAEISKANKGGFAGEMDRVKPVYRGKVKTDKGAFGWNKSEVQDQRVNVPYTGKVIVGSAKYRGPEMSSQRDKYKKIHGAEQAGHHGSNSRKEWSARAAMIPDELGEFIGRCFHPDGW